MPLTAGRPAIYCAVADPSVAAVEMPMALDWKQMAIDQLECHWEMSFRPRLTGMTDDEYFWEPSAGAPSGQGP